MSRYKYIFLVSGKARHGKDTVYLLGKDIFNWKRAAFADKLKDILIDLYDLSEEQVFGDKKEEPDTRYINNLDSDLIEVPDSEVFKELKLPEHMKVNKASVIIRNDNKEKYLTPRRMAIELGNSQRAIWSNVWVSYVFRKTVPTLLSISDNVIITDVRFPNEIKDAEKWAQAQQSNIKLVKVRVIRPGLKEINNANDQSEVSLDNYNKWNFIIYNDKSLDELKVKVEKMRAYLNNKILPISITL